jgi:hypothetical protein
MNIKASEVSKIIRNTFGKYVYSTGVHLSTHCRLNLVRCKSGGCLHTFITVEHDMKVSQALSEKRAQLAVLKEQMEMAEARRVAEKKQQLEEDEQRAQEAAELEQEMARRIELEK